LKDALTTAKTGAFTNLIAANLDKIDATVLDALDGSEFANVDALNLENAYSKHNNIFTQFKTAISDSLSRP